MHRIARLLVVAALFFALLAGSAGASMPQRPDSDAPSGAPADWLPDVQWVMERWVPFDETRLYAALDLSSDQVWAWLHVDNPDHSLDALARTQGLPVRGLASRILGPRPQGVSAVNWRLRLQRTAAVLDQQHLSIHVLFHTFHQDAIDARLPAILGVSRSAYERLLYGKEIRIRQIAAIGGKTSLEVYTAIMRLDWAEGDLGVRLGVMSETENRILRARDQQLWPNWWNYTAKVANGM